MVHALSQANGMASAATCSRRRQPASYWPLPLLCVLSLTESALVEVTFASLSRRAHTCELASLHQAEAVLQPSHHCVEAISSARAALVAGRAAGARLARGRHCARARRGQG
eukprot:6177977-Pleurochrysis_carterae.AAC.1